MSVFGDYQNKMFVSDVESAYGRTVECSEDTGESKHLPVMHLENTGSRTSLSWHSQCIDGHSVYMCNHAASKIVNFKNSTTRYRTNDGDLSTLC